jgi:hypothetical protein
MNGLYCAALNSSTVTECSGNRYVPRCRVTLFSRMLTFDAAPNGLAVSRLLPLSSNARTFEPVEQR